MKTMITSFTSIIRLLRKMLFVISNNCFDWHSEFKRSFQGRKIAMACGKKTMFDESRYFSRDEEFVFGDFLAVENSINSGSLDFLLLFDQAKSKKKNNIFNNHCCFPKMFIVIILLISNYCIGQDYEMPYVERTINNSNPNLITYTYSFRTDTLIKPEYYDVYFILSEELKNAYIKRKFYSRIISVDSAYINLIGRLLALNIDTSGIKVVSISQKAYENYSNLNLTTKTICIKIKSLKKVEILKDSIRLSGLDGIKADGHSSKANDTIEKRLLSRSIIKADKIAEQYANSQGLKIKNRESINTSYRSYQNRSNNYYTANNEMDLDDITYTLYLSVNYILEKQ